MPTIFTIGAASARGFGLFGTTLLGWNLWAWGRNDGGEAPFNNLTSYSSPTQVGALATWSFVAASGGQGSAAIKNYGTFWTWGSNVSGQLGLGNITAYSSPKQVGALTNWSKVSCNGRGMLAIKTDGTLWSWGNGANGGLGLGNSTNYSSPKQVGALTNWSSAYMGFSHAVAVKTNGTLWTWGSNSSGELGLNNITGYSSPKQVGALTTWSKVSAGVNLTSATKTDGTLWVWGDNDFGQQGQGTVRTYNPPPASPTYTYVGYSSPKQVGALTGWSTPFSSRTHKTMSATKTNGTLWTWGRNSTGQLGLGNVTNYYSPKQVGALTTWSKVSNGYQSLLAIKTDGTFWSWGRNGFGVLGLGNVTNYSSPKQVGAQTTWSAVSHEQFALALK